jgi:hypothetical protein
VKVECFFGGTVQQMGNCFDCFGSPGPETPDPVRFC